MTTCWKRTNWSLRVVQEPRMTFQESPPSAVFFIHVEIFGRYSEMVGETGNDPGKLAWEVSTSRRSWKCLMIYWHEDAWGCSAFACSSKSPSARWSILQTRGPDQRSSHPPTWLRHRAQCSRPDGHRAWFARQVSGRPHCRSAWEGWRQRCTNDTLVRLGRRAYLTGAIALLRATRAFAWTSSRLPVSCCIAELFMPPTKNESVKLDDATLCGAVYTSWRVPTCSHSWWINAS